jgi:glycosyltransferase involved in cell wall biosynthesis
MKNVCHVLDRLSVGGLEKTVLGIALNLEGYRHRIWCLKDRGPLAKTAEKRGIEVRAFGFEGRANLGAMAALADAFAKEQVDIVHSHGLYPSIWARTAAIAARVPIRVAHAQNLYYGVPFLDRQKLRTLSWITTKVIAVSEAVKESLIRAIGISPARIEVVYNSAPDMIVLDAARRSRLREEFGAGGSFVAIAVGRLEIHKGHAFLVGAVKRAADRGLDIRCLIAGDGPERGSLEERARSLGVAGRVKFLGTQDDVAELLAAADVFVQPSTIREGLPLVLAEGASAGLPLVATDVGGNSEIVADGKNGFIVPEKDEETIAQKLIFLAKNTGEAKKMGERSREVWQEKFTQEAMIRKMHDLYDRCTHERH